ncbi:uncharacterized protein BDR25DRAFT_303764 [Lindgomyces ingoldianus]|uniref:Uncharacterized protein n=1 Tax=Lindgomyces ingoldianus TaxID=673940 RepID=A0ACB6QUV6_9PLEO|nr:uncharacterized protein BDR25DRAFT_303764 [Lindgomyces ingoldianus]KAF2470774.1 hypothetical protein BDR25DRAFT_303764 [Lindgomyces ingoldianus]
MSLIKDHFRRLFRAGKTAHLTRNGNEKQPLVGWSYQNTSSEPSLCGNESLWEKETLCEKYPVPPQPKQGTSDITLAIKSTLEEPKRCSHKLLVSCSLSATTICCACADKRPKAKQYPIYIDGVGQTMRGTRWQGYCPGCRAHWGRENDLGNHLAGLKWLIDYVVTRLTLRSRPMESN